MVRTKCCMCVKPGSIPAVVKSILMSGVVVNYSTLDEKVLSRIKKS